MSKIVTRCRYAKFYEFFPVRLFKPWNTEKYIEWNNSVLCVFEGLGCLCRWRGAE